jgi:DNA-binding HxlR family transcriptional regulator
MRKENFKHLECSLARSLDMIGEWWTLLIIRDLFYGINTFDLLCQDLGIARNILADRLKKLTERKLIEKRPEEKGARKPGYRLTPKGKDLFPIIMALVAWGDRWESPHGPPILFLHQPDGHPARPIVSCAQCGEALKAGDIHPKKGPGAVRPKALPLTLRVAGKPEGVQPPSITGFSGKSQKIT